MTFAQILREWRGTATQAAAAAVLGVSLRTYQGWEAGRSAGATIEAVVRRLIALVTATAADHPAAQK